MAYELQESDLYHLSYDYVDGETVPPIIRASSNPDSRILQALLRQGGYSPSTDRDGAQEVAIPQDPHLSPNLEVAGDEDGRWLTTPLMTAIERGYQDHVRILVEAGADPNGVSLDTLREYASQWLRWGKRSRDPAVDGEDPVVEINEPGQATQIEPNERLQNVTYFTRQGAEVRFEDALIPFWTRFPPCDDWNGNDNYTGADVSVANAPMTSLMKAAQLGNIAMFDLLLELGADASYWRASNPSAGLDVHSAATRSTPLHLAIMGHHLDMIKHLLEKEFDPNILPLATPVTATTPLMASVMLSASNPTAYHLLASHPLANFELRTPFCDVHLAHFAVAASNIAVLEDIMTRTKFDLSVPTALGHTALHLAFLPSDSIDLTGLAKVRVSLRDSRCLELPYQEPSFDQNHAANRQRQMVEWLSTRCYESVSHQDVHGNTPLHYQACLSASFDSLPESLRVRPIARQTWVSTKNIYGYTPMDLAHDSV